MRSINSDHQLQTAEGQVGPSLAVSLPDLNLVHRFESLPQHSTWLVECGYQGASQLNLAAGTYTLVSYPAEEAQRSRAAEILCALAAQPQLLRVDAVTSSGQKDHIWYEPAAAGSLRAYCQARGPLPLGQVTSIARALVAALSFIHEQEFAYSQLGPDHCLFTGQGELKLLAPDLILRQEGKAKAQRLQAEDIAACAGILWYCLTGQEPQAHRLRAPLSLSLPEASDSLAQTLEDAIDLRSQQPSLSDLQAVFDLAADPQPLELHLSAPEGALASLPAYREPDEPAQVSLEPGLTLGGRALRVPRGKAGQGKGASPRGSKLRGAKRGRASSSSQRLPNLSATGPSRPFRGRKALALVALPSLAGLGLVLLTLFGQQEQQTPPLAQEQGGVVELSEDLSSLDQAAQKQVAESQAAQGQPDQSQPAQSQAAQEQDRQEPLDQEGQAQQASAGQQLTDLEISQLVAELIDQRSQVLRGQQKEAISSYALEGSPLALEDQLLLDSQEAGLLAQMTTRLSSLEAARQQGGEGGQELLVTAQVEALGYDPLLPEQELRQLGIHRSEGRVIQRVELLVRPSPQGYRLHSARPLEESS